MNKTAATGQEQPARESNINAIVSYFESGIKAFGGPGELGIELEQIIVHDDLSPVSYSGEHGVAWVLRQQAVTSVLIGASKVAQLEDAVNMLANRHFSAEELARIDAILSSSI